MSPRRLPRVGGCAAKPLRREGVALPATSVRSRMSILAPVRMAHAGRELSELPDMSRRPVRATAPSGHDLPGECGEEVPQIPVRADAASSWHVAASRAQSLSSPGAANWHVAAARAPSSSAGSPSSPLALWASPSVASLVDAAAAAATCNFSSSATKIRHCSTPLPDAAPPAVDWICPTLREECLLLATSDKSPPAPWLRNYAAPRGATPKTTSSEPAQ